MIVYVIRDKDNDGAEYDIVEIWLVPPSKNRYCNGRIKDFIQDDYGKNCLFDLRVKEFKKLFGFVTRRGTYTKMSLNLKKIQRK